MTGFATFKSLQTSYSRQQEMEPTKKYFPEIDLLKFLFAVAVAVYHGAKTFQLGFFSKGYLAVEFFFLISVFFLSRTLRSEQVPGTGRFLYRKIAPIYAVLFASTAIAFTVRMVLVHATPSRLISAAANAVWEFLLIREAGLRIGPEYNAPIWYVSAMLIAMGVLYPLFRRLRNGGLLPVASLLCSLVCYAALWHSCESLVAADRWTGFCTWRSIRAAAGLSLGVFLGETVSFAREALILPTDLGRKTFATISVLFFSAFALLIAARPSSFLPGSADFLVLPVLFVPLFLVLSGWGAIRFKNPQRFRALGTASLYVYMNHAAVLSILRRVHGISATGKIALLLAGTFLFSIGCAFAVRLLHTALRRLTPVFIEVNP